MITFTQKLKPVPFCTRNLVTEGFKLKKIYVIEILCMTLERPARLLKIIQKIHYEVKVDYFLQRRHRGFRLHFFFHFVYVTDTATLDLLYMHNYRPQH